MPVPVEAINKASPSLRHHGHSQKRAKKSNHRTPAPTSCVDVNSQLLQAIVQEKPKVLVVKRILSSGADPCTCTAEGVPASLLACSIADRDTRHALLRLLMDAGRPPGHVVNATNRSGQTCLMHSVLAGYTETVDFLLASDANVSKEDCYGNTALCYAAETGTEDIVRALTTATQNQGAAIDHRNMRGLTPLLIACRNGHLSTAQILVTEGGASPKIRDLDNFMTAGELMKKSGGSFSESDVKFLFPASRKLSHYRKQCQQRGIRTLTDFLAERTEQPVLVQGQSVVSTTSTGQNPLQLRVPSPCPGISQRSRSMFDIPPSPVFRRKPIPQKSVSSSKPHTLGSQEFKLSLYRSRNLMNRQIYVAPNRQSGFFHTGALEPIASRHSVDQTLQRCCEEMTPPTMNEKGSKKHKILPPIQKQNSEQ